MGGQIQLLERTGEVPPDIVCQPNPDNLSKGHVRRGVCGLYVEGGGRGDGLAVYVEGGGRKEWVRA